MSDVFVVLLWVQAGGAFWLAFILDLVYRRIYRELFLRFWSLSFAVMGFALAAQLVGVPPSAEELFHSLPLYLLGVPQFALVVLAALSLRSPALSRRKSYGIFFGATAALVVLCLATVWAIPDLRAMARVQRAERLVLNVCAGGFFCVEFWRRHRLARTAGGRVTVFFTAVRTLHYAALAATVMGLPLYPAAHSAISGAISTILPFGIASGMILLAAQAMTTAERALQRERELSGQVIDTIPGIFFVLDRRRRFVRWNKSQEAMLALPSERIKETQALVMIHADDQQQVADMIDGVFEAGTAETEARVRQGDTGDVRHFYLTGRRLELEGAAYLVGCGVDVTRRREAEAARAQLESRLLQSQKLESIGRLAGGVAHDFNNHLTVINGYTQLALRRTAAGDPNRHALENVLQAGERAVALTRQLLAFGRKQVLSPKPVSLNDIVSSMEPMLRRLVTEDVDIATVLDPGLGVTLADVGQIEQVLMNLVANARDAMPSGGRILIETTNMFVDTRLAERQQEMSPGPYVMLAVTDTGVGMDEATRALVFEPFFTTKELGKGTGLGLATVYGIVKQSGGAILVYSEPGRGATFKVYLPRVHDEKVPLSTSASSDGYQAGEGTILLVEDQDNVRALAQEILRSCGYRVIAACNGPRALALSDSELGSVDLLIADVVMPEMSGRELAARLAARCGKLRVLLISGYTPNVVAREGLLGPHMHFLEKPFSPAQISAKVAEILAKTPESHSFSRS